MIRHGELRCICRKRNVHSPIAKGMTHDVTTSRKHVAADIQRAWSQFNMIRHGGTECAHQRERVTPRKLKCSAA